MAENCGESRSDKSSQVLCWLETSIVQKLPSVAVGLQLIGMGQRFDAADVCPGAESLRRRAARNPLAVLRRNCLPTKAATPPINEHQSAQTALFASVLE
jgi:hypothetical protein